MFVPVETQARATHQSCPHRSLTKRHNSLLINEAGIAKQGLEAEEGTITAISRMEVK